MEFYNRLEILRKNKGLSQEELSDRLNINLSTYRTWERGIVDIGISKLNMFADFYDVSVDYILGRPYHDMYLRDQGLLEKIDKLSEKDMKVLTDFIEFLIWRNEHDI